ncbi:VanZ family protein [Bizionia sp. KMM 8389]
MLKKHSLLISIAYSVALLTVSLVRLDLNEIAEIAPSYSDKIFHFGAYALFTGLWFYTLHTQFNYSVFKTLLIVVLTSISFGTIIEVLQTELTNTRHFDFYDIAANIGGVLLATIIFVLYKKSDVK